MKQYDIVPLTEYFKGRENFIFASPPQLPHILYKSEASSDLHDSPQFRQQYTPNTLPLVRLGPPPSYNNHKNNRNDITQSLTITGTGFAAIIPRGFTK